MTHEAREQAAHGRRDRPREEVFEQENGVGQHEAADARWNRACQLMRDGDAQADGRVDGTSSVSTTPTASPHGEEETAR